jgi:hypothetical protein
VEKLAAAVEHLVAQVTGHGEVIKKLQAENDALRFELKASNDNWRSENLALRGGLKAANENFQHLEQELTALKAVANRKE